VIRWIASSVEQQSGLKGYLIEEKNMPLEGNLKDLSLTNLIQLNCQEMNEVQITLEYLGKEGVIFCSGGNIVHASTGLLAGEEAMYELLRWDGGTFFLQNGIMPRERTIDRNWNSILLEGMQRIDEGETSMEDRLNKLAHDLSEMAMVSGSVIVARDGTVLAEAVKGNAEKEGAVAVFVGNAADQIGEALVLGPLDWGVVAMGKDRMLVLEQPDFFVGLLLTEKASPTLVAAKVEETLTAWA
jgi:predicted regulator of Ras-like GTPase activity (Roadblock/LC7/MglB family)